MLGLLYIAETVTDSNSGKVKSGSTIEMIFKEYRVSMNGQSSTATSEMELQTCLPADQKLEANQVEVINAIPEKKGWMQRRAEAKKSN